MIVNLISEFDHLPKGHGIHTAYVNVFQVLKRNYKDDIHVVRNSLSKADVTHIHSIGPFALFKLLTSKPTIVTAHVIPASFVGSLIGAQYWQGLAKKYLLFFFNHAGLVIAVSPKVKEVLEDLGVKTRIEILPNPINSQVFKKDQLLREEGKKLLGIDEKSFIVLGAGQAQPRKGIEDFILVAKMLPELQFVWIGGQPFKLLNATSNKMHRLLKDKPDNLIITGIVPYEKMASYYNAADVFFFPSYQENAPMVVAEAAACGLPLVLREIPEYKLLYKNGYLAGKNNEEFRQIITRLLSDKTYYKKAVVDSEALASRFSLDTLLEGLVRCYRMI